MPQLVGLMLIGAGVWVGYKAIQRWSRRAADDRRKAENATQARDPIAAERDLGALHLDPETGVYKPISR